jgi:hypothetical protein
VNTVHDTENDIIEQRTKSENINSIECEDYDDDKEINNNNHSFYLLKSEDKRDKNDNEMHNKLKMKKFSLNDDVVVMRTSSDKIKNHSTATKKMENQANEQEILIDKNDKIRQHDELVDCEIRKSSSLLIEIGDEKEISDASDDSEILKIESNVSVVSNSIISSSPQISNDTSTSKALTTPLQIGESFFSCIQLLLSFVLKRKSCCKVILCSYRERD